MKAAFFVENLGQKNLNWASGIIRGIQEKSNNIDIEKTTLFVPSRKNNMTINHLDAPKNINEIVVIHNKDGWGPSSIAGALEKTISNEGFDIIFFPEGKSYAWIAGILGGRIKNNAFTEVVSVWVEENRIYIERLAYENTILQKYEIKRQPAIIVFKKGLYDPEEKIHQPNFRKEYFDIKEKLVMEDLPSKSQAKLEDAEIIIGVGNGFRKKEDTRIVEELANLLGAEIGCSRPLIEKGWFPKDRQIGHSGVRISPKLYIAIGISGAPYHMSGVEASRYIVAINSDKYSPISKKSDILLIGDLYEVVPKLIEAIKKKLGS